LESHFAIGKQRRNQRVCKGQGWKTREVPRNPQEVHVVLSAEKFRQTAEITIVADGMTLNSQGRDTDLHTAIDQMVEKMERQIRERQKKSKRRRSNRFSLKFPFLRSRTTIQETTEPEMSAKMSEAKSLPNPCLRRKPWLSSI